VDEARLDLAGGRRGVVIREQQRSNVGEEVGGKSCVELFLSSVTVTLMTSSLVPVARTSILRDPAFTFR